MIISEKQRDEVFEKASGVQKFLCSHPDSGEALRNIAEKYDLIERSIYKKFAILVGDFILELQDIDQGAALIQNELGVSEQAAQLIQADIKNFLAPLYTEGWTAPIEQTVDTVPDISTEILEAERQMDSLQAVRTMSTDSAALPVPQPEQTYSSVQSAILNESK
jgi:hypothetical protein